MSEDAWNSADPTGARRMPPARARIRQPLATTVQDEHRNGASEPEADYEVGYRKPPKAHRFRPGQSGNPKGRAKGSRSISAILSDELDKPITANVSGRAVTMTRRQALVRRFLEKALAGDLRALAILIKLDGAAPTSDEGASRPGQELSSAETDLLREHLAKLASEAT